MSKLKRDKVPGVNWVESHKRFKATIYISGKMKHLGMFKEYDDAVAARQQAEREKEIKQLLIDANYHEYTARNLRIRARKLGHIPTSADPDLTPGEPNVPEVSFM